VDAAKNCAVFEAREWLGHPMLPPPEWGPFTPRGTEPDGVCGEVTT
jgi:hypothetical protein